MTWDIPLSAATGNVLSVFGRTGAVVAANGDYFGVVSSALTGATSGTTRLAGALNVSGPPVSGTFQVGDMVMDPSATLWVCTVAGSPGTWSPTVSQNFAARSATATLTLNELTVFSGSTSAQTLTLPASAVHGTMNQIVNTASVSVTISGGASSLSNYGVSGNITLQPNQSVQIASNGAGGWFVISAPPYPPSWEFDYTQITSPVSLTGGFGTETTVITGASVTYDGSTTIMIEFWTPRVVTGTTANSNAVLEVWDGSTQIGGGVIIGTSPGTYDIRVPVVIRRRYTPSAGAHQFIIKGYSNTSTATVAAGAGTTTTDEPAFIRVTKV